MDQQESHDSPSRDLNCGQPANLNAQRRPVVTWNLFDAEAEVRRTARNRPHWDQPAAVAFATFRLADSMPRSAVAACLKKQAEWLKHHGLDTGDRQGTLANAPQDIQRAFRKFQNLQWNNYLDDCHGSCVLRKSEFADIVATSLLKFDGERCDMERFVIMPNHVHLLVQMRLGYGLREQCESWLRFTGRRINQLKGTFGACWSEPFDYLVRNEVKFESLRGYIVNNPAKARLASGEYTLWVRDEPRNVIHDFSQS